MEVSAQLQAVAALPPGERTLNRKTKQRKLSEELIACVS
jgi:hypothetical protein